MIPQSLFQTGFLQYEETGDYQMAKDTFVSLIAAHPETPVAGEAQFYLAELYEEKLDNPDEAVANYRVLVETYPDNKFAVEALKRVAEIMDDKERYEESIASYHQIFELYPKNTFAPEALLEIAILVIAETTLLSHGGNVLDIRLPFPQDVRHNSRMQRSTRPA